MHLCGPDVVGRAVQTDPTLGSLRYHDGDGHENVTQKVNLRSFNLYRDYSNSFTLSNASELFVSRIPKNHIQVQK